LLAHEGDAAMYRTRLARKARDEAGLMAITTPEDVKQQIPQIPITVASKPTDATVQDWIEEVETTLNATLANPPAESGWRRKARWCHVATPFDPRSRPSFRDRGRRSHAVVRFRRVMFGIKSRDERQQAGAPDYDDRVEWLMDPNHPFSVARRGGDRR
jgi:hypothetical protein